MTGLPPAHVSEASQHFRTSEPLQEVNHVAPGDAAFAQRCRVFEPAPVEAVNVSSMTKLRAVEHETLYVGPERVSVSLRGAATHRKDVISWILSWMRSMVSVGSGSAARHDGSAQATHPARRSRL